MSVGMWLRERVRGSVSYIERRGASSGKGTIGLVARPRNDAKDRGGIQRYAAFMGWAITIRY